MLKLLNDNLPAIVYMMSILTMYVIMNFTIERSDITTLLKSIKRFYVRYFIIILTTFITINILFDKFLDHSYWLSTAIVLITGYLLICIDNYKELNRSIRRHIMNLFKLFLFIKVIEFTTLAISLYPQTMLLNLLVSTIGNDYMLEYLIIMTIVQPFIVYIPYVIIKTIVSKLFKRDINYIVIKKGDFIRYDN